MDAKTVKTKCWSWGKELLKSEPIRARANPSACPLNITSAFCGIGHVCHTGTYLILQRRRS